MLRIFSILKPHYVSRFIRAVRYEGLGGAIRRTRAFLTVNTKDAGRTTVQPGPGQSIGRGNEYLNFFWSELAQKDAFHMDTPPAHLSNNRRIALIGDMNLPQCRKYRIEQLKELWATMGVELSYSHYEDVPRAIQIMQDATHLMLYRTFNGDLNTMYMYEARRLRLPVLYDLDDPLFSVSAYETYENMKALSADLKAHFVREAPRYLDAMNLSDIITVSTPGMVEHTKLYTNRPVHMRRNFADDITLDTGAAVLAAGPDRPKAPEPGDGFRIAFASGSQGHEIDFALIENDLIPFLQADPSRRMVVIGHFDEKLLPNDIQDQLETHPFSDYEAYLETLATVDCAVMPLTDDIFNRCKSAVRVLDASAVAVPAIVGQVSDMAYVVRDGETGLVVDATEGAWARAFEQLVADQDRTKDMGRAARADLETRWAASGADHIIDKDIVDWVLA